MATLYDHRTLWTSPRPERRPALEARRSYSPGEVCYFIRSPLVVTQICIEHRLVGKNPCERNLTRRERQIMDILFSARRATGSEIQQKLADAPSYSTVRTILRVLEKKGFVRHKEENLRYIYEPIPSREAARKSALQHLLQTFFDGSAHQVVVALLDPRAFRLTRAEIEELRKLIEAARKSS